MRMLPRDQTDDSTDLQSAQELAAEGELDAAIATLRDVDARDGDAMLFRAFLERQRGLFPRSAETLSTHLAAAEPSAAALLQRAYSRWMGGELVLAASDFTAAAGRSDDAALSARIDSDRAALAEQRRDMAPVAAAAATLERAWSVGVTLLALAAAVVLLRAWRGGR